MLLKSLKKDGFTEEGVAGGNRSIVCTEKEKEVAKSRRLPYTC
jgi:hypothetical protein